MKVVDFIEQHQDFSEQSRVWLYQADRVLGDLEQKEIYAAMQTFTQQWAAHGHALKASSAILYNAIIVLIVDNTVENASGCSIDSSVHFIKALGVKFGFDCFNRNSIAYMKEGEIHFTNLQNLDLAKGAQVFNLAVTSLGELKEKLVLNYEDSALSKVKIDPSFTFSL